LSFGQIGFLTLIFQVTASLLQPMVGLYTDRRPQPYSLPLGMACSLIGMVALALQQEHTHRFVDDKRTAAELFAELQAEAAERGIRLIPSDDGTFEPVEAAKWPQHISVKQSHRGRNCLCQTVSVSKTADPEGSACAQ
jgi:hypothetical protein